MVKVDDVNVHNFGRVVKLNEVVYCTKRRRDFDLNGHGVHGWMGQDHESALESAKYPLNHVACTGVLEIVELLPVDRAELCAATLGKMVMDTAIGY